MSDSSETPRVSASSVISAGLNPPVIDLGQWRFFAIGAAVFALFWPTIVAFIDMIGGPSLGSFILPFPNMWLIAMLLGFLIARADAIHLASVGAVVSVIVAVALHSKLNDIGVDDIDGSIYGYREDRSVWQVITQLALPWLWYGVLIGVGGILGERYGDRLGIVSRR